MMNSTTTIDFENLTPAGRRILDAASDLFYEHGIRAIGVDAIAEAANVTKKTIYDRFGSKDELIEAYLVRRDQHWRQLIDRRVERPDLNPHEKILAMFEIMEDEIRDRGCSFINAYGEIGEHDHPAIALSRRQKVWTLDYFVRLAREAGASDPEALGSQLLMLHEGAYIAFAMADESDASSRARDAAMKLLNAELRPGTPSN